MLVARFRQTWRERSMDWLCAAGLTGWGLIVIQSYALFDTAYYHPPAAIRLRGRGGRS